MSRSTRKTPICGWTNADSDKPYKQQCHRRERRAVNAALQSGWEAPSRRIPYNFYDAPKDGKQYFGDMIGDHRYNSWWTRETRHEIAMRCLRK